MTFEQWYATRSAVSAIYTKEQIKEIARIGFEAGHKAGLDEAAEDAAGEDI